MNNMWVEYSKRIWMIIGLCIMAGNLVAESNETHDKDDLIDVYMIPGMGTDYRIFRNFSLENGNIRYIKWEKPGNVTTLEEYASLLSDQIDISRNYVIVGVSFGGMIAVELSRKLDNPNLILISSAKNSKELPNKYKTARVLPLHLIIGDALLKNASKQQFFYKDINEEDDMLLYRQMLIENGAAFLKLQIDMIVHWKNKEYDPHIRHIHGSADKVLPARHIENAVFIEGGTHKMVVNKTAKLCEIIDQFLLEMKSDDSSQQDHDG